MSIIRNILLLMALCAVTDIQAETVFNGPTWYDYRDESLAIDGKGDYQNPIVISTPEQLAQLAWLVNEQKNTFGGKNIVLAADIDLNKEVDGKRVLWVPIGYKNSFNGNFSGIDTREQSLHHRFSISNMMVDISQSASGDHLNAGLFGQCYGFIGYLDMKDASLVVNNQAASSYNYGGGNFGLLCGFIEGTITSVSVQGSMDVTANRNSFIGGLSGAMMLGEISHATAKVSVSNASKGQALGGICGSSGVEGTQTFLLDCAADVNFTGSQVLMNNIGGVVGDANAGTTIKGCTSTGVMQDIRCELMGGIAGSQSYNTHVVASTSTVSMAANVNTNPLMGGITGRLGSFGSTIEDCVFAGHADGTYALEVGGICGRQDGTDNQYILYCMNVGTISKSTRSNALTGAIAGAAEVPLTTLAGCYYDRQMFSGDAVGGQPTLLTVKALTTRELTSGQVEDVNLLPTDNTQENGFTLRDGFYPMVFCHAKPTAGNPLKDGGLDQYVNENRIYQAGAWLASLPVAIDYGDSADEFVSNVTLKDAGNTWTAAGMEGNVVTDCLMPDDPCITVDGLTATAVSAGSCMLTINGVVSLKNDIGRYATPLNVSRQVALTVAIGQVWDGEAVVKPEFGTGTAEDPFIIKRGAHLAYAVNNNKQGEFYEQICDIWLNTGPLGEYAPSFFGTHPWVQTSTWNANYDGRGHLITGAYIKGNQFRTNALFGDISASGSVTRLGLIGAEVSGRACALAYHMDGRITNCIMQGLVKSQRINYIEDNQYDQAHIGGICYDVGPNNANALIEDCVTAMFSTRFLSDYTPFACLSATHQGKISNCLAVVPTAFSDYYFQNRDGYSAADLKNATDCYWLKGYEAAESGYTLEEIQQALTKRNLWTCEDGYFPMLKEFAQRDIAKLMTIPVRTDVGYDPYTSHLLDFSRHLTFEPGLATWEITKGTIFFQVDSDMGLIVPVRASFNAGADLGRYDNRNISGMFFIHAAYGKAYYFLPLRSSDTDVQPGISFVDAHAQQACLEAFDTNHDQTLSLDELKAVTNEQTLTAFQTWTASQIVRFPEFRFFKNVTELTTQLNGLRKLEDIDLPYALQTIGNGAFKFCDRLKEVVIPAKVTNVKAGAFYGSSVDSIFVDPFSKKFTSRDGVLFTQSDELVAYPNGRTGEEALIAGTVKRIADGAFYQVPNLKRLFFETNNYNTVPQITDGSLMGEEGMMDVYVSDATLDKALFSRYQRNKSWASYDDAGKLHQYYPLKISEQLKGTDNQGQTCYYGTFCIGFDANLPETLQPYIVSQADRENYKAYLTPKSRKVPATAAVVVTAQEPGVYRLMPYSRHLEEWPLYENRLVAVDRRGQWINQKDAAQGSILTLGYGQNNSEVVGFYPERDKSIEAYKAYLPYNTIDMDAAIAANPHYDIVFNPGLPEVSLIDGADNMEAINQYAGQHVNVKYNRTLSAVKNADGTWTSKAYTICLPYSKALYEETQPEASAMLYRLVSITNNHEFVFTNDFTYITAGTPYLVVVKAGQYSLDAEDVEIQATPTMEGMDNKVYDWNDDTQHPGTNQIGWWRGTYNIIGNEEASAMHAFGLSNGRWYPYRSDQEKYKTARLLPFRTFYVPFEYPGNISFATKFFYTENGANDDQELSDFPSDLFDSDLPDDYGEDTGIAPVIHTIDRDGTHRYFDMQGRPLDHRPTQGLYIENGKKYLKK